MMTRMTYKITLIKLKNIKACLALNNNDTSLTINADTTRMLEDISTKLTHELTILIEDLDLMSRRAFSNDEITGYTIDRNSVK